MKRYVDLVRDENPNYLWTSWQGNYGDWLHGDTLKAEGYPKGYATMPKRSLPRHSLHYHRDYFPKWPKFWVKMPISKNIRI